MQPTIQEDRSVARPAEAVVAHHQDAAVARNEIDQAREHDIDSLENRGEIIGSIDRDAAGTRAIPGVPEVVGGSVRRLDVKKE